MISSRGRGSCSLYESAACSCSPVRDMRREPSQCKPAERSVSGISSWQHTFKLTVTGNPEVGRRHRGKADRLMLLEKAGRTRVQQANEVARNDWEWLVNANLESKHTASQRVSKLSISCRSLASLTLLTTLKWVTRRPSASSFSTAWST